MRALFVYAFTCFLCDKKYKKIQKLEPQFLANILRKHHIFNMAIIHCGAKLKKKKVKEKKEHIRNVRLAAQNRYHIVYAPCHSAHIYQLQASNAASFYYRQYFRTHTNLKI